MVTRVFLRRKKRVENGEKREESEVTMGAPKGNTNALKHGLYAKHFTAEEQATLRKMAPDDYQHEIHMMRVAVNNVFEIHAHVRKMMEEAVRNNQQVDVQALAQITNTLSLAMTALNTTARTYALFAGTEPSFNEDFEEALNSLPVFLDDAYLTETNEDADEGEILTGDEGE
jgi:uncharacterized protein YjcR